MSLLEEFDSNLEVIANRLEKITTENERVKSVSDLLSDRNVSQENTNKILNDIHASFVTSSKYLSEAVSGINESTLILKKANPDKILLEVKECRSEETKHFEDLITKVSSCQTDINDLKTELLNAIKNNKYILVMNMVLIIGIIVFLISQYQN